MQPRANLGTKLFADDDDMDEDGVPSPPRHRGNGSRLFGDQRSAASHKYGIRNRPFSGDSSGSEESSIGGSVLLDMDVNTSASTPQRRKRPAGGNNPAGREAIESQGHQDMFMSPRMSPAYKTMDGRTVTSKNPFSPYTPTAPMDDVSVSTDISMGHVPEFPMQLNCASASSREDTLLPLQISLRRRDKTNTPGPFLSPNRYNPSSNRGYPARGGRYSFTGSPIEELDVQETDMTTGMGSKVRKLTLEDSASKAGHASNLFVDTKQPNQPRDNISPTDVLSFPPPTPTKASRPSLRYTPLRSAPPETPMTDRGLRARRPFGSESYDEDNIIGSSSNAKPKSRFNQDFDIIGQLGNGSFGTVYKCLSRLDGCMYAVKAAKRKAKGVSDRDRMLKEVYALAALSDQADTAAFHIVRYHQAWMEDNRLFIQTELCSSTLQQEMEQGLLHYEKRRFKLMREILLSLEFIHRNGMVHLDIKPENIFVKNDQFKLGDFGLVSKTNSGEVEEGDSRYMSMELLSGAHDDLTKSDIFSLGATMYEICLGRQLPMNGKEWQDLRAGILSPLPNTPFEMELIIKMMMAAKPQDRPKPADLLKREELLSDEQKQLIAEKHKVLEANMALALQTQRMKKLTPPRRKGLTRANTWNGTSMM